MAYFYNKQHNGFFHEKIHKNIPDGSVEISDQRHAELLAGQAEGKIIVGDGDGYPYLADNVPPKKEQVRYIRNQRDRLLMMSDWTQLPDIPKETSLKYREYRQALRDVPRQEGFPFDVIWPEKP